MIFALWYDFQGQFDSRLVLNSLPLKSPRTSCFLDNLLLNVEVAQCLLAIGFGVNGTTRKEAIGVPDESLSVPPVSSTIQHSSEGLRQPQITHT